MKLALVNVLTINVLSISLWVKRLCHHQVVAIKGSAVEGEGVRTDLKAEIFIIETAERPVLFCSNMGGWMNECKDGGMDGWKVKKLQRSVL